MKRQKNFGIPFLMEKGNVFEIKDPLTKEILKIAILPKEKLKVASFQRKQSRSHIRKLAKSIERMGFLIPLIVYTENSEYIIIDGQHRFLAGKSLGIDKFLSVIVPSYLVKKMINLNIEKQPNIKEKAYVAYNIYSYLLEKTPGIKEKEGKIEEAVEYPHYVTLGFAYIQKERFHGGTFENLLSKCDNFFDLPLREAKREREKRGKILIEVDKLLTQVIEKMNEIELPTHPFIRNEILNHINPLKGEEKKKNFEEVFSCLKERLQKYLSHPEKLREITFKEET